MVAHPTNAMPLAAAPVMVDACGMSVLVVLVPVAMPLVAAPAVISGSVISLMIVTRALVHPAARLGARLTVRRLIWSPPLLLARVVAGLSPRAALIIRRTIGLGLRPSLTRSDRYEGGADGRQDQCLHSISAC